VAIVRAESHKTFGTLSALVVYACISVFVLSLWSLRLELTNDRGSPYRRAMQLTYEPEQDRRPFVYRVLTPYLVKTGAYLLAGDRDSARRELFVEKSPYLRRLAARLNVERLRTPELVMFLAIHFVSLFGFALSVRYLLGQLWNTSRGIVDVGPAVALLCLLPLCSMARYVYDLPQLFLFSAALAALAGHRWGWFYLACILGFLNKETTCLISVGFAAYLWDQWPRKKLALHLGLQLALFGVLRVIIVAVRDPGTALTAMDNDLPNYLVSNLISLWQSSAWFSYSELIVVLIVAVMLFRKFLEKPLFLRRTALMFIPFFAAYLRGSLWGEVRVFLELYSIGFLFAFQNLAQLLGYEMRVSDDRHGRPDRILEAGSLSYLTLHVLMLAVGMLLLSVAVMALAKYV